MESILTSIKKLLGISDEYVHFDADIIMHINSALSTLAQIGVISAEGFIITGDTEVWNQLVPEGQNLENIKQYVYLKVKLVFDPPSQSSVLESYQRLIDQLEWRINVAVETPKTEPTS